jgi:AcrR family transcriptional regulator
MSEQVVGRRERKKRATRAALSEVALRLSIERGIDNVTVEQIADQVDVSLRTFFNYFSSKEEAIVAGDVAVAESLVDAFRGRPPGELVLEALRHAVLAVLDQDSYRDRVQRMQTLRRTPSLLPYQLAAFVAQERSLAAAVAERVGCDADRDLYPALVAASAMAGLRVAVHRWLGEPSASGQRPSLRPKLIQIAPEGHSSTAARTSASCSVPGWVSSTITVPSSWLWSNTAGAHNAHCPAPTQTVVSA